MSFFGAHLQELKTNLNRLPYVPGRAVLRFLWG